MCDQPITNCEACGQSCAAWTCIYKKDPLHLKSDKNIQHYNSTLEVNNTIFYMYIVFTRLELCLVHLIFVTAICAT